MANQKDKQADKWRQFRWIPALFVCSLLISSVLLSLNTHNLTALPAGGIGQTTDPLQPLVTLIPDAVKSNLLYAFLIALLVTGTACAVYALISRGRNKIQ